MNMKKSLLAQVSRKAFPPPTSKRFHDFQAIWSSSEIFRPSAESSAGQSAVSTASFIRTDSRLKGEGATYKAGNPGIFHIARLKGHDIPQVFINIFSRDDDEPV